MKDLKHMIYFEKLLDSACNDLVREAQKENRVAVGYTCFHIPEVLLNLDHCFSVRLRVRIWVYRDCNVLSGKQCLRIFQSIAGTGDRGRISVSGCDCRG